MAPLTSLIVPVYNTHDYVRDCLSSVLATGHQDLEVIVVDDASTDGSLEVIEDIASGDARVKVVRLTENGGLGNARNMGLRVATGDWVMFLDSDDLMITSAFEHLSTTQRSTKADIIMFDFARLYTTNRIRRSSHRALANTNGREVTAFEAPEILSVLNVAWNKAYRTSFLRHVNTSFPTGFYEDIPWTYLHLIEAKSVFILDQVMILYRQQRKGRILGTPSDRHLDLIVQYEILLEELKSRGHTYWIPLIFDRMIEHGTFLLAEGKHRLSPQSQQVLFSELSKTYNRWKPTDLPRTGLRRMRHRIVERGGSLRRRYQFLFRLRPRRFVSRVVNEARSRVTDRFGRDPARIVS